ncbi:ABC-F family ATP-binding cassette domain-containing protein [Ruminococcus sp. HUN007]|uniref:ABC-F family ATP-binding cassette domain-containing protein n=1 Tax=Ruminococcus sp. HUN007 TaxID=1514668 RepID=UPI001FA746C2|nr:ABC-F family ATP-binding cassette domain-containing protein [Ruminococcus sp. HUN007]
MNRNGGKQMLLSMTNVNKFYNGNQILKDINLTIDENDRIGLIGVNGCGKTTLLRLITGKEDPDRFTEEDGIISFASKTNIGYLEQMGALDNENTVIEEMKGVFSELYAVSDRMKELEKLMAENPVDYEKLSGEYAQKSSYYEANDGYNIKVKIKTILNGMGFTEDLFDRVISSFSGGEKTRLAIAKLLLENPNILILDEPTNHLDFRTVMWLEDYLKDYKGALLIVSHDRYFLDKTVTSICEIENTVLTRYKGNYTNFTKLKAEAVTRQQKEYELQQKEIAKMEDYVARNMARASTSKSAKSRVKALDKMERIEKPNTYHKAAKLEFTFAMDPPQEVLKVKDIDVSVGFGDDRRTLVDGLSFEVRRGEKLAVIGDNGIGKSSLLKVIQEKLPHKGKVIWAANVKISYFDQEAANINRMNTVFEEIHSRYPLLSDLEVRNLLGRVRLVGENVFKQAGVVSGGERCKLCFAIMMMEHGNVLILDEPTNHLDLQTKEVLEDALERFEGTIIYVSHDRYLLNRISTRILEITANGTESYAGGFDDYMKAKNAREQAAAEAVTAAKQEQLRKEYAEKKEKAFKTKEQRNIDAKNRQRIRDIEKQMEELQKEQETLESELTDEKVLADYNLMNEKCMRINEIKELSNELFDEWAELSETLQ